MDKNFITTQNWTKFWAGNWSIQTCSYWGDMYVRTLQIQGEKPCVIGTEKATKVFRDGDMVEVDAERGKVTLVKRDNS